VFEMAGLLPALSFRGVVDYFALAAGIMLGIAVLTAPFDNLESSFRKQ